MSLLSIIYLSIYLSIYIYIYICTVTYIIPFHLCFYVIYDMYVEIDKFLVNMTKQALVGYRIKGATELNSIQKSECHTQR